MPPTFSTANYTRGRKKVKQKQAQYEWEIAAAKQNGGADLI
jgi:hypothetical protein